jgi:N-acetylglutamate synthase
VNTFDLERLLLAAWPAREMTSLHGWSVLTDGGVTGRPNAVSPLKFDGKLGEAITEVESHYRSRDMRPAFRIARGACAPVDLPEVLISHGWKPSQETLVMTASLADALSRLPANDGVALSESCPPAFDAVIRETSDSAAEYEERRGLALRTPRPRAFAMIPDGDAAQAIGLCVIVEGQAGIFLMRTHPAHRRKGLARRVMAGMFGWARENGASGAFLQVEADNAPAISLYQAAAFKSVYSYDYWREETIP